jgi:acyl-CoA synthetase (AMP-forming)/AMP-acid ligase II/acyl carrier protein
MWRTATDIIDILQGHASRIPQHTAFVWLREDGEPAGQWGFAELYQRVGRVAGLLGQHGLQGKRALLLYSHPIDFIAALLACQYAGIVAVPVFYAANKRYQTKLAAISADAQVAAVLTAKGLAVQPPLADQWQQQGLVTICTDIDALPDTPAPRAERADIAFIQYTSGSTGRPKGVVITPQNLVHNQGLLQAAFRCNQGSVILSWLPFHHGLIGNLLHSVYVGCTCVVMEPFHFVQQPLRWLRAIGRYRATHSGGPNFAYDHCVAKIPPQALEGIDLSTWKVAFNGAEPIRAATLQAFAGHCKGAGFDINAFYPCYGMAEATLLVSGAKAAPAPGGPHILHVTGTGPNGKLLLANDAGPDTRAMVGCGLLPPGMEAMVVGPNGPAAELQEGEICIGGNSVTQGYWNSDNKDLFCQINGQQLLRTGDTGFFYKGELFVSGRIKEMLIVRGQNFYPYDIERSAAEAVDLIEPNGVAAFGVPTPDEALVLVAELKRTHLQSFDAGSVLEAIGAEITATFGIAPYDVVLVPPLAIPRTTSGKIQRLQCKALYTENKWAVLAALRAVPQQGSTAGPDTAALLQTVRQSATAQNIEAYLAGLITDKTGHSIKNASADLAAMGIDSLRAMELINTINNSLNINMDVTAIFEHHTIAALARAMEHLLWLKNSGTTGGATIEI